MAVEIAYPNRIRPGASDEHLRGIGLVALSWSILEGAVERIVWRLARIDNDRIGLCITTHTNIQTRLDVAGSLMNLHFPKTPLAARLKKLDRHIRRQLMPARNEIVHSRIVPNLFSDPSAAARVVTRARGQLKHEIVDVIPADYDNAALAILGAATEARSILLATLNLIEKLALLKP